MDDEKNGLRLATAEEVQQTLAFSLRFRGGKRVHDADEMMARIVADRLIEHLRISGFVYVMWKPSVEPNSITCHPICK